VFSKQNDKYKISKHTGLAFCLHLDYAIKSILRKGNGFYEVFMEEIMEGIHYIL